MFWVRESRCDRLFRILLAPFFYEFFWDPPDFNRPAPLVILLLCNCYFVTMLSAFTHTTRRTRLPHTHDTNLLSMGPCMSSPAAPYVGKPTIHMVWKVPAADETEIDQFWVDHETWMKSAHSVRGWFVDFGCFR